MHKVISAILATVSIVALSSCTSVRDQQGESASIAPGTQGPQRFRSRITDPIDCRYLLFLPRGYGQLDAQKWPLVLFLHGAGERGTNIEKVTVHGPPKIVKTKKDFPFVLVAPQCPSGRSWREDEVLALLDNVIARLKVDTNRIYLTGLSMGGYGSWSLGSRYPERFAAIAPICGGGDILPLLLPSSEAKHALKGLGVWAFHGAKDPTVSLDESRRMTNAFIRAGCKEVKLTIYPEAYHDSWTQAYNDPELWKWFLAHRRGAPAQ